jgi:hypothetical protein
VAVQTVAALIAELARGRLRKKRAALEGAPARGFGAHLRQSVLVVLMLARIGEFGAEIT